MPTREWRLRINDILDSIAAIQRYVDGMDLEALKNDPKTTDAVIHRFVIIGEAANNVPETITAAYPGIPWRRMREMRNVIVHAYFGVSHRIVWETINRDLPPLVPQLQQLLAKEQ